MFRRHFLGVAIALAVLAALLALTPAGSNLRTLISGSDQDSAKARHNAHGETEGLPPKSSRTTRDPFSRKLDTIIIPRIDFDDTTVEEAIDFLRQRSRELDSDDPDPTKKGISFVIRKPRLEGNFHDIDAELDAEEEPGGLDPGATRIISWQAENIPLTEALDEITRRTGLRWKIDDYAITLLPLDPTTPLPPHPKAPKPDPR